MTPRLAPLVLLFITSCATADVVTSTGDTHVLRVDGGHIDNWPHVNRAMNIRASKICPAGWETISNRTEPHGKTWAGNPAHRFERTIRCI